MGDQDAFGRILASLHHAMLDDTRGPGTSALIAEARALKRRAAVRGCAVAVLVREDLAGGLVDSSAVLAILFNERGSRGRHCGNSLNRISKCFCVFANPSVPCHDHDQRRWLVNHLRCSQMHGVERTNWLDRKRPANTSENRVCDTDYVTPKLKTTERAHCRSFFVGRQPRRCTRSKNRPCGFGNRQCGSDPPPPPPSSTDRFQCVRVTLQKRGDQRAGLDVPHTSGFQGRMRRLGATLGHVRRQSARRQFPPEARCPATLRSGHRLRVVGE